MRPGSRNVRSKYQSPSVPGHVWRALFLTNTNWPRATLFPLVANTYTVLIVRLPEIKQKKVPEVSGLFFLGFENLNLGLRQTTLGNCCWVHRCFDQLQGCFYDNSFFVYQGFQYNLVHGRALYLENTKEYNIVGFAKKARPHPSLAGPRVFFFIMGPSPVEGGGTRADLVGWLSSFCFKKDFLEYDCANRGWDPFQLFSRAADVNCGNRMLSLSSSRSSTKFFKMQKECNIFL